MRTVTLPAARICRYQCEKRAPESESSGKEISLSHFCHSSWPSDAGRSHLVENRFSPEHHLASES